MQETILGVPLWFGKRAEFLERVNAWIKAGERGKVVATVNPEFVMKAQKDKNFGKLLTKTDLNVPDGIGLVWARGIGDRKGFGNRFWRAFEVGVEILAGKHKNEVLPGSELIKNMCNLASERGYSVFLLGGYGKRAQKAGEALARQCKGLKWEACEGAPDISNMEIIKRINRVKPDMLFVAYGMGKQENWIMENKERLDFVVAMGVGRTFDYYSGDLKRAPAWVRRSGFEWLYSLIKEPKRWRRQLALPQFIGKVLAES